MNEEDLLLRKRNYLLAYIDTKEIDKGKLDNIKTILEKYNNGYVRYQDFKSMDWGKGIPENLEWKIIIFGVNGKENIKSLVTEAKKYNVEIRRYTGNIIE